MYKNINEEVFLNNYILLLKSYGIFIDKRLCRINTGYDFDLSGLEVRYENHHLDRYLHCVENYDDVSLETIHDIVSRVEDSLTSMEHAKQNLKETAKKLKW